MDTSKNTSPNDFKVVQFTNKADFTFTPDMGCMYDGRPISGITGAPGINAGESMTLPYHIGHRLAMNLAKAMQLRRAPIMDEANNPVGKPLWNDDEIERLKNTFLTELYVEEKAIPMTETDRLMAKVEEYKQMVDKLVATKAPEAPVEAPVANSTGTDAPIVVNAPSTPVLAPVSFADKQDVIAELTKRGIKFDARQNKANLEKLLV